VTKIDRIGIGLAENEPTSEVRIDGYSELSGVIPQAMALPNAGENFRGIETNSSIHRRFAIKCGGAKLGSDRAPQFLGRVADDVIECVMPISQHTG
jgi:hypothetical protein